MWSNFKTKPAPEPSPVQPLKCTYCGGTDWLGGPEGGMAQNVLCANQSCRHWFNLSPFGLDDLKRREPTPDQYALQQAAADAERDKQDLEWRKEGAALYRSGKDPSACIVDKTYTYLRVHEGETIQRLFGFIGAMQSDIGLVLRGRREPSAAADPWSAQ